jgi:hypothetical protein
MIALDQSVIAGSKHSRAAGNYWGAYCGKLLFVWQYQLWSYTNVGSNHSPLFY